jgi:hypothetical protein
MNRAQRIIVAIYCLLLAYCCIWIPWRETTTLPSGRKYDDVFYSLVWVAPDTYGRCAAVPEIKLIILRVVALTAVSAAVFVLSGMLWKSATR